MTPHTMLLTINYGTLTGILLSLFLTSCLYAIVLEWLEQRYNLTTDFTWLTVVVGIAFTLLGVAFISPISAILALVCFTVTGIPMVARAIIIDARKRSALRDAIRGHDDE